MGSEVSQTVILKALFDLPLPSLIHHCRRKNGQEGFIPANYVKEMEPAKVKKVVKKKEMISVPVKVKKTRIEKRYAKISHLKWISIVSNKAHL